MRITVLYITLNWFGLSWGEVWEKDMSEEIYIEASHEGFNKVIMLMYNCTLYYCDISCYVCCIKRAGSTLTLGSPDWTVQVNSCTVHLVPARIMQLLEWGNT